MSESQATAFLMSLPTFSSQPSGRRKSTDRLPVGELWRDVGTDHGRLSERTAQSSDRGGGHLQRYDEPGPHSQLSHDSIFWFSLSCWFVFLFTHMCVYACVCAYLCVCVCAGWPRLLWFVTDGKHVVKPPKDWHPLIREASDDIAYIEVSGAAASSTSSTL